MLKIKRDPMKKLILIIVAVLITPILVMAQSYQLPEYTTFTLPNGLVVNLMEQHEVPIIAANVILPAGAIYDGDNSGMASLTADALMLGTKKYTKTELDEALDFVGANIYTGAQKEYATLNAKFAAKDQDLVLDIIKELLLYPTFDAAEFEKEKNRTLIALERQNESPRSIIQSYFDVLLYGNHVYGNILQGTLPSVGALKTTDLMEFYKTNYSPDGSALSIVGNFSSKDMKQRITTLFAEWKKSPSSRVTTTTPATAIPTETRILLVNKEDANETTFYIGAPGMSRNNPELVDISIINTLFGGRFTSMLNDELRVNSGLTYGASSRFDPLRHGGSFVISTFTAKETTEAAIDMALEVLNKLHREGLDAQALASAKNYVKGQFPPKYETVTQLAGLLGEMFWYDFDKSYINTFQKKVDALDLRKANDIIDRFFPKENLQIVLIGKASEIRDVAGKYGKVIETEINTYPKM